MKQIKITSNPYARQTNFQIFDMNSNDWITINKSNNPNSKLLNEEFQLQFFPFKIQDIVNTLIKEYGVGEDRLEIIFKGTPDHFNELEQIIKMTKSPCEIVLLRDETYLINAHEVLPEIVNIFKTLRPIIDLSEKNKNQVKDNIDKFSDSSTDKIPLCVIGNYSSGKSTFINALIGKEILPSGDDPVTAKVFKINQLENNNNTYIKFIYEGNDIQILIYDKTYEILGICSTSFESEIRNVLNGSIEYGNIKCVNTCITLINKIDSSKISPIIEIGTSFVGGIWNQCKSKFIILDTPGSNSATNLDHSEVLDEALKGLTNGLPLYVSEPDKLNTNDNLSLYNKLKSMEEIDSRFTMIIVNKADDGDLPEDGYYSKEEEINILEQIVPKKMYSIGVYFVSSIMGLGSKCNGEFANNHSRKIFRKNKDMFDDPEDFDYTCLYNYNIMPQQIKINSIEKCKEVQDNLIYVNSGLYAIEHGIQNFANKYSSYNKCKQSLMYLENIIELINDEISELKLTSEIKEKELTESLEEEKNNLLTTISNTGNQRKDEYVENGRIYLKQYTQENKPSVTHKDLVSLITIFLKY